VSLAGNYEDSADELPPMSPTKVGITLESKRARKLKLCGFFFSFQVVGFWFFSSFFFHPALEGNKWVLGASPGRAVLYFGFFK
jgi:hypothetical protein